MEVVGDGRAQPEHRIQLKDLLSLDADRVREYGLNASQMRGAIALGRKFLSGDGRLAGASEIARQTVREKVAQCMPGVKMWKELNLEPDFLGNNTGNMNADKVAEFMQGIPGNRGFNREFAAEIWSEQDGLLCDIMAQACKIKQSEEFKKASENALHKTLLETSQSTNIHRAHALIWEHVAYLARGRKAAKGSGEASTHYGSQP
jgi:hypothetical protein